MRELLKEWAQTFAALMVPGVGMSVVFASVYPVVVVLGGAVFTLVMSAQDEGWQ